MAIAALAVLAGCTDPRLNAGLSYGSDGLTVRPSASASLGGLRVGVAP